jgi:hypothetical protein
MLKMRNVVLTLVAFLTYGVAQTPPAKVAANQTEADLINSIPTDTNPTTRLQKLERWSKEFPQTAFDIERKRLYLATYQQLMKPRETINAAQEIMKTDPNDFESIRAILASVYQLVQGNNPPPAPDLELAEKLSGRLLNDAAIFAAGNMPQGYTAAQWGQVKAPMQTFAQRTIAWVYVLRKDNPRAETEVTKALQMNPNDGQADQWLGQVILAQNQAHPEKQPVALFYYARAASYEGQGALDANARKAIGDFLKRAYTQYHGSEDGLTQLLAEAKTNPAPPADLKILSTADIAEAKAKAEIAARAAAGPMLTLWGDIKKELTGDGGAAYFESSVKDAGLPPTGVGFTKLKAKIISMKPATRPKEIVLALEKPDVADITLKFDEPLAGTMEAGSDLEFSGKVIGFTKEPFMLTFDVEPTDLVGWTGKNTGNTKKAAPKAGAATKKKQ